MTATAAGLAVALALPTKAAPRCMDEEPRPRVVPPAVTQSARQALQALLLRGLQRSQAVGASRLVADAAEFDLQEARAGALPQASLSANAGHGGNSYGGVTLDSRSQAQLGLSLNAPLYDSGRVAAQSSWRTHLAEAALQGLFSAQEQVALQTVSLALEHARYTMQVQVYQQYMRKMGCLVESLETIVDVDRGRASELVQARKSLQQTQLSLAQAVSSVRQAELRLRRYVSDVPLPQEDLSSALQEVPELSEIQARVPQSGDMAQLAAQANAAESLRRAVDANGKPRVDWVTSVNKAAGQGTPATWFLGMNLNVPLLNPGQDPAVAAAQRRAQAARAQYGDALEARLSRAQDLHEQAVAAVDRAQRVIDVLDDSERVRENTLQQWQQLGRRSLFDVMAAESDYYGLRVAYINALFDGQQANALLWSLGPGIQSGLQ